MSLPAVFPALILFGTPGQVAAPPPLVAIETLAGTTAALPDGAIISLQTTLPPLPAAAPDETAPVRETPADRSIVVSANASGHTKGDPLEHLNRRFFNAHEKVDKAIIRPVALGYKHVVPKPVRSGLRNFISNLTEPIVFLNDLLQFKPSRAVKTLGRFVFNSTLGLGGVLDIAKLPGFNLPHRPNGFGDTLGYYGVKPGPYLFLPLLGPTDLRDLLGGQADGLVLPLAVGHPFDQAKYQIPKGVLGGLDQRAEADDDLNALFGGAVDPYATLRSVYLQNRAGEIAELKGEPAAIAAPGDELADPLADPAAGSGTAPSATPELSDPMTDPAAQTPAAAPPEAQSSAPELNDPMADPAKSN